MRLITKTPLAFALLAVLAMATSSLHAQNSADLDGAWIVTSWTAPDGTVNDSPQRGVFIFAVTREDGGSYSIMYVGGSEPRAEYEIGEQTDEDRLAAYASFTANTGRLQIEGNELTYEAYVAKDPNYMATFEDNGVTVGWKVEDDILTLTYTSGRQAGLVATFRRPTSGE
jgi:hypothetical protein